MSSQGWDALLPPPVAATAGTTADGRPVVDLDFGDDADAAAQWLLHALQASRGGGDGGGGEAGAEDGLSTAMIRVSVAEENSDGVMVPARLPAAEHGHSRGSGGGHGHSHGGPLVSCPPCAASVAAVMGMCVAAWYAWYALLFAQTCLTAENPTEGCFSAWLAPALGPGSYLAGLVFFHLGGAACIAAAVGPIALVVSLMRTSGRRTAYTIVALLVAVVAPLLAWLLLLLASSPAVIPAHAGQLALVADAIAAVAVARFHLAAPSSHSGNNLHTL
ncbi:uncharacterized protein AMSG_01430 [Thecamonas trahens ATCC 50062]|uniref:Uncharacterized protein n=1 Tax=Thecamonas trahens ATCC 50062 TaxID=461836 RepID=A0A0L0DN86_THETB|nr:hypothetical protein AMSG_01430 [Thecamonas trahens ATCC 50062]KNC53720.1 hypothetical protein AMSG_01430 [Thecamonas trahens ATCC 50062]|eukprot:XP_013762034.1 hypothetical protein AMSG_01430 [Thecamonas trahens ATCC 50062]